MGHTYSQLSLGERCEIGLLVRDGYSRRSIAARLGRSASTISRELERNGRATKRWPGGYDGERAHGLAARRRRLGDEFGRQRVVEVASPHESRIA